MRVLKCCLATTALLGMAAVSLGRNEDFTLDVQPVFPRLPVGSFDFPVLVKIENKGPDARGAIQVSGSIDTSYPVELPRGAKKTLIVYANPYASYSDEGVVLDTDRCHIQMRIPSAGYGERSMRGILLITDTPGELSFVRRDRVGSESSPQSGRELQDVYMKPGVGPDRASGFRDFALVILGTGAERLPDAQVAALKRWTLAGGMLVFVGGASSPVLSDPRWNGVRPGERFSPRTVTEPPRKRPGRRLASSGVPDNSLFGDALPPLSDPITMLEPDSSAARDSEVKSVYRRPYGIGQAVYLAFNPFEQPMARWSGRRELFQQLFGTLDSAQDQLFRYEHQGGDDYAYSASYPYTGAAPYSSTAYSPTYPQQVRNPFQTTLPPKSSIAWVLFVYLAIVGPLNFFVLGRLKKGEWAWLTAPVISLGAAAVLFTNAGNLYSAKSATSTKGLLIVQQGSPEGYFVGSSQMFFPHGGSTDLGLEGVETIGAGEDAYSRYGGNRDTFSAVDVGELKVPALRTSNLAFKEMSFRQHLSLPSLLQVTWKREGNKVRCSVRNVSEFEMAGVQLDLRGHTATFGSNLGPGQSGSTIIDLDGPKQDMSPGFPALSAEHHGGFIEAHIRGLRPGPNVGADIDSDINLIYGLNVPREVLK